jgi:hypothetical protein
VVELVFMMLILKLPILYLVGVCWWAIRAEPSPPEQAVAAVQHGHGPRRWQRKPGPRPRRGSPHGPGPARGARAQRTRA